MACESGDGGGLYRSSIANDPDSELVPQSQLLDPSNYKEKAVPAFDEADYQSKCLSGGVVAYTVYSKAGRRGSYIVYLT